MRRRVHTLEVRPFRGLEEGETVAWEGHGGLGFKGLFAGWRGEVVVTDRRVIFKRATWEFEYAEIDGVSLTRPQAGSSATSSAAWLGYSTRSSSGSMTPGNGPRRSRSRCAARAG